MFQVYLAKLQTFFPLNTFLPTVILFLLDFEPIVFDLSSKPLRPSQGLEHILSGASGRIEHRGAEGEDTRIADRTQESQGGNKTSEDNAPKNGRVGDRNHVSSFSFYRGKSCVFAAEPTDLSRALRRPTSFTLVVASKLSQHQVRGNDMPENPRKRVLVRKPVPMVVRVSSY